MANQYAIPTYDSLEATETNLDAFIIATQMNLNVKEACQSMSPQIQNLVVMLQSFNGAAGPGDGRAKVASGNITNLAGQLFRSMKHAMDSFEGADGEHLSRQAMELKNCIKEARRTYLSRDSMIRMSAI